MRGYLSPTWTLHVRLTSASNYYDLTAEADGAGGFEIDIPAATTADYSAGPYSWLAYVTNDSNERYSLQTGSIEVLPDLAVATQGVDTRSRNKRILDAIEALIEGRAASDVEEYSINGRDVRKMSLDSLLRWREYYRDQVRAEDSAIGVKTGGRRILATFGRRK